MFVWASVRQQWLKNRDWDRPTEVTTAQKETYILRNCVPLKPERKANKHVNFLFHIEIEKEYILHPGCLKFTECQMVLFGVQTPVFRNSY